MAAELRHANLRSTDLSGTNLRGANLRWANLSGANLKEADLTDAKLSGADLMGAQLEGATLENTTLVHADLNRTNLRRVRCVGVDLSGATLTGAQMYAAIAYDVQTSEIICEWIDLSPQGDQSQRRYFNTGNDVHTFLNQRPPQVNIVVDTVMTLEAHAALATIYAQLGKMSAVFTRPPDVELTNRRTILKFVADSAIGLSAIAYLTTWPFQYGQTIRQVLATFMSQSQKSPERSFVYTESHRELQTVIEALQQRHLTDLQKIIDDHTFFSAPIQVKLLNAHGRTLELFHHPRFGIRNLPAANGLLPAESGTPPVPDLDDYLAFLSPTTS